MAMSNPFEEVIKHGFGWLKLNYEYKGLFAPQAQMLDFRNNSNLIRITNMTHSWFFLFKKIFFNLF
jgi:hypothetical protein